MKVKDNGIRLVLRKDGYHHVNGKKVKAYYPREGWSVMLFMEHSPIDKDFEIVGEDHVLVLTQKQLDELNDKMKLSDEKTRELLGHGWRHGPRPHPDPTPDLHEMM